MKRATVLISLLVCLLITQSVFLVNLNKKNSLNNKRIEKILKRIESFDQSKTAYDLSAIRSFIINSTPGFHQLTDLEKAISVNEWIYRNVSLKNSRVDFPWHQPFMGFFNSITNQEYGHICGGMAWMLITGLESVGLPARYVGLFSGTDESIKNYANHASVEVWIDGKFMAIDPTFNVTFTDSKGKFVSWIEIAELNKKNEKFNILRGKTIFKGRDLLEYHVPIRQVLNFVAVQPLRVDGSEFDAIFFPTDWTGIIKGKGDKGKSFDIHETLAFYKDYVGKGFLRKHTPKGE